MISYTQRRMMAQYEQLTLRYLVPYKLLTDVDGTISE
jgi:hypothetical protein